MRKLFLVLIFLFYSSNIYAAITATGLTSGSDTTDATSYATASISPTGNNLILACVNSRRASGTVTDATASGNGITWVKVASIAFGVNKLIIFRGMVASPSADAITFSFSETQTQCNWQIIEFANVDTSGTNGSGAVVQSVTNTGGSNTASTVTLAALNASTSMGFAFQEQNSNQIVPDGSIVEIYDVQSAEEARRTESMYQLNQTILSATWSGAAFWSIIGVEIKVPTAATRNRLIVVD